VKKLLSGSAFVGIIAFLTFSCNQNQGGNAGSHKDSLSAVADKGVVYVNTDTLISKYDFYKDIEKESKDEVGKVQLDLEARGRSFENEVVDFQKRGREMSLVQQEQTKQSLAQKEQYLIQYKNEAQQRLMEKEQKRTVELNKRIRDYLKKYSKEKGYQFVLGFSEANSGVLFANPQSDVTEDVLKGLNADYKTEKDSTKAK
jgi:outer membrane protein